MLIIGCDWHPRYQIVAWVEEETGEVMTRRLEHENGEARRFYESLPPGAIVGIEATFPSYWFERLLAECGHELWVGDAARIRASVVRRQKTDTRDAEHLLELLRTGRFPRIWVPSLEERDLRQLLVHRMKLVRIRTAVKNQLQALAISQGVCRKQKLWSVRGRAELDSLALLPWASRRRQDLLGRLEQLDGSVEELDQAVEEAARGRAEGVLLRPHPGVGPVVGLAFVLTLGPVERFPEQPQAGQLSGPEFPRALQRRAPAAGGEQQARQLAAALAAGGSGADGGALRSRVAARLSTAEVSAGQRGGESGHCPTAGRAFVLDAARARVNYAQMVRMSGSPSRAVVPRRAGSKV